MFRRVSDGVRKHHVQMPVAEVAARLDEQRKRERAARAKAEARARAEAEAAASAAEESAMRESIEAELRAELASTHELARLGMCLWRAAHGGKRPRAGTRFRRDDACLADRMLLLFVAEFPVVARVCDTERATSDEAKTRAVIARTVVFDWLDGVTLL